MEALHFRFAADILKRLGEELNPNLDQSILELVRNSYDADALDCTVELRFGPKGLSRILVEDDGDGMEPGDIQEGWLVLGRSPKGQSRATTRLGRLPSGNKGLGRLAALRAGKIARLITRPRDDPGYEYSLEIDWSRFDAAEVVEDVNLEIRKAQRAPGTSCGTAITIEELRGMDLGRVDVKRLARGLLLLADPFTDTPAGFRPVLKSPEYKDLERLVQRKYFDDAEFHLTASVDSTGRASAKALDWKGRELFAAAHEDLSVGNEAVYQCPPAEFDLWIFILNEATFATRRSTIGEVREWLDNFGGVHLYVRGLRVSPYGNKGHDWLELNLRRAQSPELRPSTNTSIGRIRVSDPTEILKQKTDRSGLVENDTFLELKRFATSALDWLARERLRERDRKKTSAKQESSRRVVHRRSHVEQLIEKLPETRRKPLERAFKAYDVVRETEAREAGKDLQLYRTLSTTGIASGVFAHELTNPLLLIKENVKQAETRAKAALDGRYEEVLGRQLERIARQADSLAVYGQVTLELLDHEKRRAVRVDVHEVIRDFIEMFHPLASLRRVTITPKLVAANPFLRGSEAAIDSILANAVMNSLKAFESSGTENRQVEISTDLENGWLKLRVLDNGPGIKGISVNDVWLPGETTYPNGTGLGLAIVRDTVRDLGGKVKAVAKGTLGGAEIIVELPIEGA